MTEGRTIQARAALKVVEAAARAGVRSEALCAAAQIDPVLIQDPERRLPYSRFVALYEHAARLSRDEAFGLHLAERVSPGMFDVLGYAVMNSASLADGLDRLIRYYRIWADGSVHALEVEGTIVRLTYAVLDLRPEACRQEVEASLAIPVCIGRALTGIDWVPRAVEFQHAPPRDVAEHRRLFGSAPVRFRRPANALVFDRAVLGLPVLRADETLCAVLDRHAAELLGKLPKGDGVADRVRQLLRRSLPGGEPNLKSTAAGLGLSARTLQRKLRQQGFSHQELLEEMRRDLSQQYLSQPELALCEVAYLLGFSDSSAFHRAFRRWTGMTPGEFRRRREHG